jgi:hypothetical protein
MTDRDFYRVKLRAAFCRSAAFLGDPGRSAADVADTPECEAILRDCSPGSFECARRIGEVAVVYLGRLPAATGGLPWWQDLLNYERGVFLQEATTAPGPPANRPRRGASAVCMKFSWAVPELIERIQSGQRIGADLRRPVVLLFARARDGAPRVVEVGDRVERVFRATNGLRTLPQIAAAAGTSPDETTRILDALAQIGAVTPAMSPEEMTRIINEREAK